MLKLPKGLKKKKKGKKSKRKGDDELFTEEELEKYRKEHQQHQQHQPPEGEEGPAAANQNEEWSKFKDLTTGVDSVLRKTQGDLDRIKSTSFFQRVPAGVKEARQVEPAREEATRPAVQVTAADFPRLAQAHAQAAAEAGGEAGGATDDESEEEEDDIFDTSYVEAVERGALRLFDTDSPDEPPDDGLFDTSHVDALIKGQEARTGRGKKALDIGVAVEVLTGRIDNVTVTTTKRSKRGIPGDLLLESTDKEPAARVAAAAARSDHVQTSLLDTDSDIPITTPIDLSVSLHTSLIQQNRRSEEEPFAGAGLSEEQRPADEDDELDEFTLLAAESLEASADVIKVKEKEIILEPVLQESWSAFEADKNQSVFAECIVEDQIDVVDPYVDEDDPFDTSFADAVVPSAARAQRAVREDDILENDDDFDPRAEEIRLRLNNRRKSSVRIHLTDPSGVRESITSDDLADREQPAVRDLLGGSTTDLTQLGDSPLDPVGVSDGDVDPFDTTIVDKIVAPGKVELKLLEEELIGASPARPAAPPIYRVPSDPDFDPRADEPEKAERRASRPENLVVSKSVIFDVDDEQSDNLDIRPKPAKPVTPYYTREHSISEELDEAGEAGDALPGPLPRARSDEDLAPRAPPPASRARRRHSELPPPPPPGARVLTPAAPAPLRAAAPADPFDTSFTGEIAPSKTELKLLAKEFSCEESAADDGALEGRPDLLEPSDDIFQVKALTPEPSIAARLPAEEIDPFDTSFAGDLNPGRTELKLLESEFLN